MMKWAWLILLALSVPAAAQSTQTFGNYVNGLPAASTLGSNDQFYVRQGGTSKQVPFSQLSSGGGGGGGSSSITRAQIAITTLTGVNQITVAGYRTVGDLGDGCVYSSVGATATGLQVIKSLDGTIFNLIFPDGVARVGCFGAYADDGATLIATSDVINNAGVWRGTYTAGVTPWDQVGVQELWYAAFAGTSTPQSINWNTVTGNQNLNLIAAVGMGRYGVVSRTTLNMEGGQVVFASKGGSLIDYIGSVDDSAIYCDGCSYSRFVNVGCNVSTRASYNGAVPCFSLDWSGNIASLKTQQNSIYDFWCNVGKNGQCAEISISGSGSQGDTNNFFNPVFLGFESDFALKVNGSNALDNNVYGGDVQGFTHTGFVNAGGKLNIYGSGFQNENTCCQGNISPLSTQFTRYGADYDLTGSTGGSGPSSIHGVRTESDIYALAYGQGGSFFGAGIGINLDGLLVSPGPNDAIAWQSGTSFQEGTVISDIISGGTDGRFFMLVNGGGTDWKTITSYVGSVITDATASYTVNQWAGYNLNARFDSSGFFEQCDIVSNTATTITLDSGCSDPSSQGTYQIVGLSGGSAPNWNTASVGSQAAFTGGGQGFNIAAGSTCINVPSGLSPSIGDYVAIPDGILVGKSGNPTDPGILVAEITGQGSCGSGFGNTTISRPAGISHTQWPGYTATPIADAGTGTLEWIDFEFVAIGPLTALANAQIAGGLIEVGGAITNVYNAGANTKNDGLDATFTTGTIPAIGPGQLTFSVNNSNPKNFNYSAAIFALPGCGSLDAGAIASVADATTPVTFHSAYASGGAIVSPVYCTGSGWAND